MKWILILSFFLITVSVTAQKYDYNWAMGFGYPDTLVDPYQGNKVFIMKFGQPQLMFDTISDSYNEIIKKYIHLEQDGKASYSNFNGEFKYASDGKRIYDSNWDVMKNGDSINFGPKWNTYLYSHPVPYGMIPIPDPANKYKFSYILHTTIIKPGSSHIAKYTKIDLEGNNSLGVVVEKNKPIFENEDSLENILPVQHANGRDWWVICHKFKSTKYFKKLLTPKGFTDMGYQELGANEPPNNLFISTSVMSRKGDKYCRYSPMGMFQICDFDRCSGLLSNPITIEVPDSLINFGRMCFSNSGKFLYSTGESNLTKNIYICQTDITLTPAQSNIISKYPIENQIECHAYFQIEMGPDDRIYIGSLAGSKCLGVINYPDNLASACDYKLYSNFLPFDMGNYGNSNHFTNYRLGPLIGSGCDTITSTLELKDNNPIAITYPNPATEKITLELMNYLQHNDNLDLSLIDISGKLLYTGKIPPYAYIHNIDIKDLVPGIYCILIKDKLKLLGSLKLIKQ